MSNNDRYKYVGDFWERPGDIRMLGPLSVEKKSDESYFQPAWNFARYAMEFYKYRCEK